MSSGAADLDSRWWSEAEPSERSPNPQADEKYARLKADHGRARNIPAMRPRTSSARALHLFLGRHARGIVGGGAGSQHFVGGQSAFGLRRRL